MQPRWRRHFGPHSCMLDICWSGEDRINSKLTTPRRRQARFRCSLRRRAESAGGGSASSKCRQSWKSRLQIPVETWASEGVAS
jgi:hypothetical protein